MSKDSPPTYRSPSLWIGSAMFLVAGIVLWIWPASSFGDHDTPPKESSIQKTQIITKFDDALLERFDLSKLPKPIQRKNPPQRIDPLASLRSFSLVGVVQGDVKKMALVNSTNKTLMIETGSTLGGFIVEKIGSRSISLRKGDVEHIMTMVPEATSRPSHQLSLSRPG